MRNLRRTVAVSALSALLIGLMAAPAFAPVLGPPAPAPGPVDMDGDGLMSNLEAALGTSDIEADQWVGTLGSWIVVYSAPNQLRTYFFPQVAAVGLGVGFHEVDSHGDVVSAAVNDAAPKLKGKVAKEVSKTDWAR